MDGSRVDAIARAVATRSSRCSIPRIFAGGIAGGAMGAGLTRGDVRVASAQVGSPGYYGVAGDTKSCVTNADCAAGSCCRCEGGLCVGTCGGCLVCTSNSSCHIENECASNRPACQDCNPARGVCEAKKCDRARCLECKPPDGFRTVCNYGACKSYRDVEVQDCVNEECREKSRVCLGGLRPRCCPNGECCGSLQCLEAGETCSGGKTSCPVDQTCCGATCCPGDIDYKCCGEDCCPFSGTCYLPGPKLACCAGMKCAGSTLCCKDDTPICRGKECCDAGGSCLIDGTCCPFPDELCGSGTLPRR